MQGTLTSALRRAARLSAFGAKRNQTKRRGVERWYPYYAGFSERFARLLLEAIPIGRGAVVLDPWNGSGTTTTVADRLGFRAIGYDLNPVAALIASAKLARPDDAEHLSGLIGRVGAMTLSQGDVSSELDPDPLNEWLGNASARTYRALEREILTDLGTTVDGTRIYVASGCVPPLASFLILALMRAAKSLVPIRPSTNPTWVRPPTCTNIDPSELVTSWQLMAVDMASDLVTSSRGGNVSQTRLGDARSLPLATASVDFVLTSPPYCTRIDYAISTTFELAALGISRSDTQFSDLRRSLMGTPLARPGGLSRVPEHWPAGVKNLLERVRTHPSKASHSYYYKTYYQYFADCMESMRELKRCLRPGSSAVLVVQTSHYKDVHVDLPSLYMEIGTTFGFTCEVVSQTEVRRALVQINPRARHAHLDASSKEAVLCLENSHATC